MTLKKFFLFVFVVFFTVPTFCFSVDVEERTKAINASLTEARESDNPFLHYAAKQEDEFRKRVGGEIQVAREDLVQRVSGQVLVRI